MSDDSDDDVFFVESSDEELPPNKNELRTSPLGDRKVQSPHEALRRAAMTETPSPSLHARSGAQLSMEDILFERPVAPAGRQRGLDGDMNSVAHEGARDAEDAAALEESPVPLEMLSGGAVNAVPKPVRESPPRDLAYLRSMTCSEVREKLETFFLRKEAQEKKFRGVEAEMEAKAREDAEALVELDLATLRQRDRCARLVNVGNWNDGNDSPNDVLLPAPLVAASSFHTQRPSSEGHTGGGTVGITTTTTRTLRKHQIEGIRFMWRVLQEGPVGQVPAVGCILAHTMGLGKTAQVVLFVHLFAAAHRNWHSTNASPSSVSTAATSSTDASRPPLPRVLIVVPKSTVSVWEREFASWGSTFPAAHRLVPLTLDESSSGPGSSVSGSGYRTPARRVQLFRQWRRRGGVFVVGYEALVRLMQLVEEDNVISGHHNGRGGGTESYRGEPRQGQTGGTTDGNSTLSEAVQRQLKSARRRDEGGFAYGGNDDPFTELVVCDEAHRLKSIHLHIVTALRGLHPLRRLLLTGTPLQNHLSEYWAMIDFAVHKYFDRHRFKDFFVHSIESSASKTASKQEVALAKKKTFTLINEVKHFVQRVDSTPLRSELPPLHEYVVVVPLSDLQKSIYTRFVKLISTMYDDRSGRFQFLPAVSFAGKIASHPQLLFALRDQKRATSRSAGTAAQQQQRGRPRQPPRGQQSLVTSAPSRKTATTKAARPQRKTPRKEGKQKRRKPRASDSEDDDSVLSDSDSLFSSSSSAATGAETSSEASASSESGERNGSIVIDDDDSEGDGTGATSRVSFSQLYENSTDYDSLSEAPPNYVPRLEDGVKLHVAMNIIKAAIRKDEKVLLFSLSTRLLDFFEALVAEANARRNPVTDPIPIQYRRLDGSHTGAQRANMLSDFNRTDSSLNLFLLSMKAGGVGITITAATRVILVDSSFNPADDQQAIGRAYRYGQTKPVFVYRLLCYQTLEFSIFEQKLAKEWLFKTVIDETAMKRDALSGMHLRQIFSMLDRAAKDMKKAPKITAQQLAMTKALVQEDDVLKAVQDQILYAQRHEVFLSHDDTAQYGAEEQQYYDKYRKERMFDVGDNVLPHELLEQELNRTKRQREQQSQMLRSEAQTLTGLVDRLIRSRATTDPHLARLLTVMGLHVDPETGSVRSGGGSAAGHHPENRFTMGGRIAAEDSGLTVPSSSDDEDGDEGVDHYERRRRRLSGGERQGTREAPPGRSHATSGEHPVPQTDVLLLDEDEDGGARAAPQVGQAQTTTHEVSHRPGVVVDPNRYAPYRPGNSVNNAIDIDSE